MGQLLLIDDDPFIGSLIESKLPAEYSLLKAANGDVGIAMAKSQQPDVILLDVEMPGKNGYEVCDILKHDPATCNMPVIFISSKASLRERVLGYEMGGDDYLAKPFDAEILIVKLQKIRETHEEKINLLSQIEQVRKTASEAINGNSELSLMVKYQQSIQNLNSHESIVNCFFDSTRQLGLKCCLLLEIDHNKLFYSCTGENKPLEQEMMYLLHKEKKRFNDFGCRTQISYPNIALLVKNMPLGDAYRYGRLKDLLPIMIEATSSKLTAIEAEMLLRQQIIDTDHAAIHVQEALKSIAKSLQENQQESKHVIHHMMNILQDKFPNMGLEEDQEKFLLETIEEGINGAYKVTDKGAEIESALTEITKDFSTIQAKQTEILAIFTKCTQAESKDFSITSDIELF